MSDKIILGYLLIPLIHLLCFGCTRGRDNGSGEAQNEIEADWIVPERDKQLNNPYSDSIAVAEGKSLYQVYCWSCHGDTGLGDGAAGGAMGSQPANFHTAEFKRQSDGAIFWKISKGRETMPSFEEVLTENQRWQLVAYIRKLGEGENHLLVEAPIPLKEDISIAHWMQVEPRAVRIMYQPESNHIWYATFIGDVFRVNLGKQPFEAQKIVTVEDHGISRMQGAVISGNTLYLTGNVRVNDNKGTTGRMMRVELDVNGNHEVSRVFSTEEYGTTNTPFDHGWSATEISPDGKYIFVVSGSRTDHGEVQDNLGAYPGSRDEPLTARIFRFPIDARDLWLPNDLQQLKDAGYVYAEGIRNAFDMAFDARGNLFAVVNSGDYDQAEDMFWVREGHHYGFPWVMGGMETPQQFPDWHPDPEKDLFLNPTAAAWPDDFYNDPGFAKRPEGVVFTPGMNNYGPDANQYRDTETGNIMDGTDTGKTISSFTPHSSPLGLMFDNDRKLSGKYRGTAFTLRYTNGSKSSLMQPFTNEGEDLLHLILTYNEGKDNYDLKAIRIAEGFNQPVDAVLVDQDIYVIEYGGRQKGGNIWKVSLP